MLKEIYDYAKWERDNTDIEAQVEAYQNVMDKIVRFATAQGIDLVLEEPEEE